MQTQHLKYYDEHIPLLLINFSKKCWPNFEVKRVTMKLPVLYSCVSVPLVLLRLGRHLNCVMCEEGAQNRGLCGGRRAAPLRPAATLPEQCLSLALPHHAAWGCCSEKMLFLLVKGRKRITTICHKSCIEA